MSVSTVTPYVVSLHVPPRPSVASDLDGIEWDGRWEVIDGMAVVNLSPGLPHQHRTGRALFPFVVRVIPSELVR